MRKPVPAARGARRALACLVLGVLAGCGGNEAGAGGQDGGTARAEALIREYGCGGCHEIPRIPSARGRVGPPLAGVAQRAYLAGFLPNSQEQLAAWILAPQEHDPDTAMPDMGLGREEAVTIAAWLYGE